MGEKPEQETGKTGSKNERLLQKLRRGLIESIVGSAVQTFEVQREIAMKGYTTLLPRDIPSNNFRPSFTPPPESLLYHVGDLWDGYFFTAMVYWGLTFPTLFLPEKFLYHGKNKLSPENIRLAIAFSMVMAGIIIAEANDPKDIPAGVAGAALFLAIHLSTDKVSQFTKRASNKTVESLPVIAQKISTLTKKVEGLVK